MSGAPQTFRSALLASLLLTPLLLSGCDSGQVAAKAEPIRFVERLDVAEVRWGAGADAVPPEELPAARIGSKDRHLVRVMMSETGGHAASDRWFFDDRLALLAPAGTRYRFPVRLPEDPFLQLGLGYVNAPEGPSSRVRFEVRVEVPGAESEVILDEETSIEAEGRWRDRELTLARWAGRDVVVQLETFGEPTAWAAWGAPEVVSRRGREDGWDVILISLDTLRADHLGCYGYSRPTSPSIDALARRGVRFATAVSQSPWTRPSHFALFSGLHPVSRQGLASPMLAALLWRRGYRTLAMTAGGQVHPRLGFNAGFETYRVEDWIRSVDEVVERFARGRGRKQFLFLHTYEVHDPYVHHTFTEGLPSGRIGNLFSKANGDAGRLGTSPTAEEKAFVTALYDGGIAFADEQLGRLFAEWEARGVFERAIIVLTSDHGEQFWEHRRWGHGSTMYDHQLLVPLIVYLPPALRRELTGDAGSVVTQQVRLIDVYPTILDLLDIPLPRPVQGRSLRPLLAGGTLPDVDAFAENTNVDFEAKALRTGRLKLVYSFPRNRKSQRQFSRLDLFDLRRDPGETTSLADEHPEVTEELFVRMMEIIRGSRDADRLSSVPDNLDPRLREQLEALGYLGD